MACMLYAKWNSGGNTKYNSFLNQKFTKIQKKINKIAISHYINWMPVIPDNVLLKVQVKAAVFILIWRRTSEAKFNPR